MFRPLFYPQYKTFWKWKSVGDHEFTGSIFNQIRTFTEDTPYTFHLSDAEKVIADFKKYIESNKSYVRVHFA